MNVQLQSSRAELLSLLDEFLQLFPSLRVGQAVCNLTMLAGREANMWDLEDDELVSAMQEMMEQYKAINSKIPA